MDFYMAPTPNCTQMSRMNSTDRTACREIHCSSTSSKTQYKACDIEEAESLTCYEMKRNLNKQTQCKYRISRFIDYGNYGQFNTSIWVNLGCSAAFDVCYETDPAYLLTTTPVNHLFIAKVGVIVGGTFLWMLSLTILIICLICCRGAKTKSGKGSRRRQNNAHETELHVFTDEFVNHNQSSNPSYLYIDGIPTRETDITPPSYDSATEEGDYIYEDIEIKREVNEYNRLNTSNEREMPESRGYDLVSDVLTSLPQGDNVYNSLRRENRKPPVIPAQPYDECSGPVYAEVDKSRLSKRTTENNNVEGVT